jgi:transposase
LTVDTLEHLLALHVTPADQQDREQVAELAQTVQEVTGGTVDVAFVDQRYTGESAQTQAQDFGMDLVVVKHTEAQRGFVLLPRHWVVERSIAWAARFRRLARAMSGWPARWHAGRTVFRRVRLPHAQ